MYKRKLLIGGIATLAMVVVVGSGFAVWNFETGDDASKGIYNLGLYVTPKVETVGTVSVNNEYALILDQGALPQLSGEATLDTNPDYFRRGIYVGKLRSKEDGTYETLPNGSYAYDEVSNLSAVWIQSKEDAEATIAENVNDIEFTTTIKLKKTLATYVQVRPNLNYMGTKTQEEIFVVDKDQPDTDYVSYTYNWGKLSDVLVLGEDSQYHTEWRRREVCEIVQNREWKETHCGIDGGEPTGDDWRNDNTFLTMEDLEKLPPKFSENETKIYRTSNLGLYLKPCNAVMVYMIYDAITGKAHSFYTDSASAEKVRGGLDTKDHDYQVSVSYFKYVKDGSELKNDDSDLFVNEVPTDKESEISYKAVEGTIEVNTTDDSGTLEFKTTECYEFTYSLNTANYGPKGTTVVTDAESGATTTKYLYENSRFVYYPYDFADSTEPPLKGDDVFTNVSGVEYVKKPSSFDEYQDMLKAFTGDAVEGSQFVDLSQKYVVVEFGSRLITKGSSVQQIEQVD